MMAKRVSSVRGGAEDENSVSSNHPRFQAPPLLSLTNQPISLSSSVYFILYCIGRLHRHT